MSNDVWGGPDDTKARGDVAAERVCLRCKRTFWSEGFGERICQRCKNTKVWSTAVSIGAGRPATGRR